MFRACTSGMEELVQSKNAYAEIPHRRLHGADSQIRTGDLILTKDALYLLSYISTSHLSDAEIMLPHFCGKCNTQF